MACQAIPGPEWNNTDRNILFHGSLCHKIDCTITSGSYNHVIITVHDHGMYLLVLRKIFPNLYVISGSGSQAAFNLRQKVLFIHGLSPGNWVNYEQDFFHFSYQLTKKYHPRFCGITIIMRKLIYKFPNYQISK